MINIRDLHFEKEILPLFDFTINDITRSVLTGMLTAMPGSLEAITERQQIIKGFLHNKKLLTPFSYPRSEFNEVYDYFEQLSDKTLNLPGRSMRWHLLFAGKERQRESARLSQLILFLHKVNSFYFTRLDTDVFPASFNSRLENIRQFIATLRVREYQAVAKTKGLSINHIVVMNRIIYEMIRNGKATLFWEDFFIFESYLSIAKGIARHHFNFPQFSGNDFSLTNFYHPLLEKPVRNSLVIQEPVMVLTGPNMSGKSTLLKAIGLCVYLGHLGVGVPAEQCVLPFFDTISIAINPHDDIKNGYSHFMTEIKTLKKVVLQAGQSKKCFAIFDELFRGTNVEDALAILTTTITGLTKFSGSCFLVSTHLQQLRHNIPFDKSNISAYYVEGQLQENQPVFTYQLQKGWSDLQFGQIIFEQEGLSQLLSSNEVSGFR